MSTTCMVRKASKAWALDIGTPAALSFFSSARASRKAKACDENVCPHPFGLPMVDGAHLDEIFELPKASGVPPSQRPQGAAKPVFRELNLRLIFTIRPEFSEVC